MLLPMKYKVINDTVSVLIDTCLFLYLLLPFYLFPHVIRKYTAFLGILICHISPKNRMQHFRCDMIDTKWTKIVS